MIWEQTAGSGTEETGRLQKDQGLNGPHEADRGRTQNARQANNQIEGHLKGAPSPQKILTTRLSFHAYFDPLLYSFLYLLLYYNVYYPIFYIIFCIFYILYSLFFIFIILNILYIL